MASQAGAFVRRLTGEEGQRLVRTAHSTRNQGARRRAMILLASAQGRSPEAIASLIGGSVDYVGEVIHAFNEHGFKTLDWTRKGAGDDPQAIADTIVGALAASPWPAPVIWASRAPGRPRPPGHRFEPPRPSSPVERTSNGRAAPQDAQDLAPSRVPLQAPPRPRAATGDGELRVDELGPLILQPPEGWAASRAPVQPASVPPAPEGLSSGERQRLHELERENARLRQERELLKAAAAFFAAESQKT